MTPCPSRLLVWAALALRLTLLTATASALELPDLIDGPPAILLHVVELLATGQDLSWAVYHLYADDGAPPALLPSNTVTLRGRGSASHYLEAVWIRHDWRDRRRQALQVLTSSPQLSQPQHPPSPQPAAPPSPSHRPPAPPPPPFPPFPPRAPAEVSPSTVLDWFDTNRPIAVRLLGGQTLTMTSMAFYLFDYSNPTAGTILPLTGEALHLLTFNPIQLAAPDATLRFEDVTMVLPCGDFRRLVQSLCNDPAALPYHPEVVIRDSYMHIVNMTSRAPGLDGTPGTGGRVQWVNVTLTCMSLFVGPQPPACVTGSVSDGRELYEASRTALMDESAETVILFLTSNVTLPADGSWEQVRFPSSNQLVLRGNPARKTTLDLSGIAEAWALAQPTNGGGGDLSDTQGIRPTVLLHDLLLVNLPYPSRSNGPMSLLAVSLPCFGVQRGILWDGAPQISLVNCTVVIPDKELDFVADAAEAGRASTDVWPGEPPGAFDVTVLGSPTAAGLSGLLEVKRLELLSEARLTDSNLMSASRFESLTAGTTPLLPTSRVWLMELLGARDPKTVGQWGLGGLAVFSGLQQALASLAAMLPANDSRPVYNPIRFILGPDDQTIPALGATLNSDSPAITINSSWCSQAPAAGSCVVDGDPMQGIPQSLKPSVGRGRGGAGGRAFSDLKGAIGRFSLLRPITLRNLVLYNLAPGGTHPPMDPDGPGGTHPPMEPYTEGPSTLPVPPILRPSDAAWVNSSLPLWLFDYARSGSDVRDEPESSTQREPSLAFDATPEAEQASAAAPASLGDNLAQQARRRQQEKRPPSPMLLLENVTLVVPVREWRALVVAVLKSHAPEALAAAQRKPQAPPTPPSPPPPSPPPRPPRPPPKYRQNITGGGSTSDSGDFPSTPPVYGASLPLFGDRGEIPEGLLRRVVALPAARASPLYGGVPDYAPPQNPQLPEFPNPLLDPASPRPPAPPRALPEPTYADTARAALLDFAATSQMLSYSYIAGELVLAVARHYGWSGINVTITHRLPPDAPAGARLLPYLDLTLPYDDIANMRIDFELDGRAPPIDFKLDVRPPPKVPRASPAVPASWNRSKEGGGNALGSNAPSPSPSPDPPPPSSGRPSWVVPLAASLAAVGGTLLILVAVAARRRRRSRRYDDEQQKKRGVAGESPQTAAIRMGCEGALQHNSDSSTKDKASDLSAEGAAAASSHGMPLTAGAAAPEGGPSGGGGDAYCGGYAPKLPATAAVTDSTGRSSTDSTAVDEATDGAAPGHRQAAPPSPSAAQTDKAAPIKTAVAAAAAAAGERAPASSDLMRPPVTGCSDANGGGTSSTCVASGEVRGGTSCSVVMALQQISPAAAVPSSRMQHPKTNRAALARALASNPGLASVVSTAPSSVGGLPWKLVGGHQPPHPELKTARAGAGDGGGDGGERAAAAFPGGSVDDAVFWSDLTAYFRAASRLGGSESALTRTADRNVGDNSVINPPSNILTKREGLSDRLERALQAKPRGMAEAIAAVQAELRDPEVQLEDVIGCGSFGVVYRGLWRHLPVAVKTLVVSGELAGGEGRARQRAVLEAAISMAMAHPNVVATYAYHVKQLIMQPPAAAAAGDGEEAEGDSLGGGIGGGLYSGDGTIPPSLSQPRDQRVISANASDAVKLYIIQEYCNGGTLRDALDRGLLGSIRSEGFAGLLARRLALDVAIGMRHIHSCRIAHADLKPENVLLVWGERHRGDDGGEVAAVAAGSGSDNGWPSLQLSAKVADFGLSIPLPEGATHASRHFHGTPAYQAPEVRHAGQLSPRADVWSFGVLLIELCLGCSANDMLATCAAVLGGARFDEWFQQRPNHERIKEVFFASFTDAAGYAELVDRCLSRDPRDRPDFEEVVARLQDLMRAPTSQS